MRAAHLTARPLLGFPTKLAYAAGAMANAAKTRGLTVLPMISCNPVIGLAGVAGGAGRCGQPVRT